MRLILAAVGRLKAGPERELASRYRDRAAQLGRGLGFATCDSIEIAESRARRALDRCAEEAAALTGHMPPGGVLVAYDERGRADIGSEALAERVAAWRDAARPALVVAIGGPDGLDASIRTKAELILSFGAATLPHGLVRVLALEQLYRSLTILSGHPYHRGEAG
ncbi:23S rRNA (pseudouridine(1915)-N(3))-methyltransferase RlmH [Methylobacterium sp. 092160098-2]|jgi:23S rRNA (pseudouridine1915-N3)-methyltransferase|uniref:Ribosomal RNA large subunit methyltransferase H n=1 Tax=Methylobacterium oryzae CBMB20 TaxID=693986 RepID=A0A089NJ09_9HYPH|nr:MULTISPECIES: 23S rRNA (pseudouridine(1915)-N(3))-methyltransferase RlmH [Methylobacterium]AIQ87856.1 Ribosomal RNA large subunit methyltransferase H [Methylobacterium oryzae CBMB20]AWV14381.1 23S rRNA (pseudouridine(1915)-N(3))-methyltransferase RlmH [Methylobacterium sp. XJLW]MDE4909806.1 23S rRNA (pseudouridine(1915)-N(3))-methyltransferase RlmH [Methylobacterium sp. 092160098-2]WFS07881.1 23S rRNA (pseudouridine(1915)-N(3))-methyltransferase RlmH [Methylobacterium sp. 391_Methyba4]